MSRTLAQTAVAYARAGYHVFPCRPGGKEPLTPRGFRDASADPEQVASWWRDNPDANIGCLPAGNGHVVLDVDVKADAGGEEALADLEIVNDDLPETREVATPSGGRHLWLALPDDMDAPGNARPADGIDVRSANGYVLLPPSQTPAGAYRFANPTKPAPVPAEWRDAFRPSRSRDREPAPEAAGELDHAADVERATRHAQRAPVAVEGAEGSKQTYKVACELRAYGLSEETTFGVMAQHYNPRCNPPWDAGPDAAGPDALASRVASAYRNARQDAGERSAGNIGETVFGDVPATAVPVDDETEPMDDNEIDEVERKTAKPRFLTEQDVDDAEPPEWDIVDTLPRQSLIALYGEPGTHKSFLALDWANHLARGMDWGGYETDAPRRVLYVAGEGTPGLQKRLRAWREHHDADMSDNLIVSPDMPRIDDSDTWAEWVSDVAELGEIDLVVFDTLAYLTVGLEENSNSDMMQALNRIKQIKETFGASVLLVHHSGKDGKDMRGATAILGACDTTFRMSKDDTGGSSLEMQKQKDAEKWKGVLSIQAQEYTVGQETRGRPITSLALVPGHMNDVPTKQERRLNENEAKQVENAEERQDEQQDAAVMGYEIDQILAAHGGGPMGIMALAGHLAMERWGQNDKETAEMMRDRVRKYVNRFDAVKAFVAQRDKRGRPAWFGKPEKMG